MNYHCFKRKVFVPLLVIPALFSVAANAQDSVVDTSILDRANTAAAENFRRAAASQARVVELSDEADELAQQYDEVAKAVDGLEVYNAGMRQTIAQQEVVIAEYEEAIANAAALQRQIPPLMERMMVALEQFVELDIPFQKEARRARLAQIRDTFDDSSVNIAERFRLVLQAYEQEMTYGRSPQHATATLEVDGVERDVDMLRVGRIALVYQTSDQTIAGMWDNENQQWVELGSEYRRPIAQAIRVVEGLTAPEMIELPISAPESAQ